MDRTRTPTEVKRDQKLADIHGDLHQGIGEIRERLDRLGLDQIRAESARQRKPIMSTASSRPETTSDVTYPTTLTNPFGDTGRIEDPVRYLVRQPLTNEIMTELHKGVSVSIVGDSQTGKSSLLWHLKTTGPTVLKRSAADFVYLSLELIRSVDDFYEELCAELALPCLNKPNHLARKLKGRRIVLCLDEIEKMTGFGHEARSELRGLAGGSNAPLTLVIASRSPLNRLFPDSPELTSPLAGLCHRFDLPPFSLAETQAFVRQRLAPLTLTLPDSDIEQAWQITGGHPCHLQQALKEIFDRRFRL